jgi:hypothetical protein
MQIDRADIRNFDRDFFIGISVECFWRAARTATEFALKHQNF